MTTKHDDGKPRYDLIPPRALAAFVRVLTFGARKYAPDNWRTVPDRRQRYYAAAQRHLWAWWQGETHDPETGESHLAHALCCIAFLLDEDPVRAVPPATPTPKRQRRSRSA